MKTLFLSRLEWDTSQLFRKSLTSLRALTLLLVMCLSIGNVWGATEETATLTFNAACGGSGTDDKDTTWTITSDAAESTYEEARGIHYGTGKKAVSHITLTSSSFTKTITKIVVNASDASAAAKIDVTVGGTTFGSQSGTLTSSNAAYTFTPIAAQASTDFKGAVVVKISKNSVAKALYCKSIAVTYTIEGGDPEAPSFTTQPVGATYEQGASVTPLSVVATGDPTPTYQWYSNSTQSTEGAASISGATTASYSPSTTNVGTTYYYCVASNSEGNATSDIVAIQVNEHTVTPGKYNIVPNNTFWGNTQSGSVTVEKNTAFGPKTQNDITVSMNSGNSTSSYINSSSCRVYNGYTFTVAVPSGYLITAISFTGNTWVAPTASVGTMNSKDWTGSAPSVTFTFSGTSYMTNIEVTYAAEVSSPVTFSNPDHGTLAIKNGDDAIATGDNIKMGTELTVNVTAESDAYRLDSVKVIKTGADPEEDVTATVYSKSTGKITMPAYAITVSAVMEANNYDVTFHKNVAPAEDDYTQTFTYTVAQNLTANAFTAPTGYEFYKWATTAEGEGTIADKAEYTLPSAADADLYAKWTAKNISVTLDKNGSSEDGLALINYDATEVGDIEHVAAWAAHTLKGYYTAASAGDKVLTAEGEFAGNVEGWIVDGKWAKSEDCTLYAQWESAENYNISYDLTGCTADAGNPTEIALSAEDVTLNFDLGANRTWTGANVAVSMGGASVSSDDYTFENGALWIVPTGGFNGDVTVTIVCQYAPATLTLSENGSESSYGSNLKVNDEVTLPNCEVQCDKVFVGWSEKNADITASDVLAVGTSYTLPATSNKLYAVFATETPGETTDVYTMNITKNTSNSAYATYYDVTFNSIGWKMPGNQASGAWVKMGGNVSTATDRYIYSKNAISSSVDKVVANHGVKDDAITVNSVRLDVYSTAALAAAGAAGDISSVSGTYTDNGNTTFERPSTANWTGRFYRITYNMSSSTSSNKGIILYSVKMQSVAAPTYSDYTVTCSAKTAAPVFSLDGGEYTEAQTLTITAETGAKIYYNINSDDDPTSESTEYTEAISLNTWGTKTIKAIAIADGKSVSDVVSATYVMNLPFASLEALVAQDMGSLTSATVTVSFSNVPIKSIATSYDSRVGVYFDIQKEEKDIEIYCTGVPETWQAGGKLSKSNLTCTWKRYVNKQSEFVCWELTPSSWDGFTYSDPAHITSIVISGEPTKKSYSDGQTLESDGLVVTGYYDDHTELAPHSEVITEGLTWTLPTLTEGQISAEVTVKYTEPILSTELTSEAYQVTGLSVSAAKVLQSIYVADDSEHQIKFFVGRPFSSAGLKVMAKYNIGDDEPVTPTSISTPTMTSEGEQTITITYTENEVEKQTSYKITLAYMDLNDLVAATDIESGDYVYVKFSDQQIKSFYTSGGSNKGIFFDIQKESNDIEIYANGTNCPNTWEQYGTVSATLNNVQWTKYGDIWELKPSNWDAFTYNAPNVPVTSMVVDPASTTIGEMATTTLSIVYTPSYATNKGVTWSVTEGDEYASVNATTGEVTGLKEGSATITATLTADPSIIATCAVTVNATAKCVISYVVKGEEASTQTIARSEASALTYVPAAVSGHTFVGWAESDVTEETTTPVTVITEYTPGAEEANKTLYAVYKYEDTSVAGYGNYNKITAAPADWSGKYLFVSETGNCAVKGSAIAASSLSHTAVTIDKEHGVIAANDALLAEVLEVKKGTTNYTIKGGNGMYFTYNGTENGFTAATTGAIEYPIAYANSRTEITCPTSGGATMQVNENTVSGSKVYTFRFYKSSQKAMQLYKLVEGTFYYTSYPSVKYTITFDADGGTGACPKIVVNAGENATICEDAPTKELNKFNGWSDGVNNYDAGATIENVSKDIELTAQWIAKVQYTISFDKAGAEGTTPSDITDYEGNEVTLPTKGDMSYEGYIFKGWNDGETNYAGGSKFTMPEKNVAMSAVWQDASETHWALVINEKQLKAGDKVIIVAAKYDKALAAQVETKYRSVVDITKSTDKYYVTESEDEPTTLTVGITDSKITFHDGNGYLYASSTSSNYMDVQEVLDDNGKWNVTISNGVATINSVGNTSKPMMQYNAGNPRVSCYGSKQDAGDLAIYKYYETLPEYVERNLTSANIGTSCIAQGGVEEYAFSGATFYEILNKDVDEKNVYFQEVTSLVAGMPYVFQPNAGAEQILMMVGGDEATAQSKNGLYGWLSDNYEFSSQIDSKDVYFVSGGKIVRCGNECTILKNRAYIVLDEISGQVSEVPGRRRLTLGVDGKGVATGMEDAIIMSNGELKKVVIDGQFYILRDGKVFDAQGKLVK